MPNRMTDQEMANEIWYWYLNGGNSAGFPTFLRLQMTALSGAFRLLPGKPRCIQCNAPLSGFGAAVVKPFGYGASVLTPKLCNSCEKVIFSAEGGAEVELTLLFADIRGSTSMAEQQGALEYRNFIQRFYKATSGTLIEHNALVNRLAGDQAIGLFVPRFAGANHAAVALQAAADILRLTGHADPQGPWAPVGIGVHTDTAYVGVVGSKGGVNEIAVLGNAANLTARLSSAAAAGELLVSEQAAALANLPREGLERRSLSLKGISKPVPVRVVTLAAPAPGMSGTIASDTKP
ncbi:MAG TPA: adenylate/guanylate cyclase domain-containing protein [Anaerolineales bacterium]|nr:adenylate/guanylate cyclase domain-containing protein [Anaerolineales bacterium]